MYYVYTWYSTNKYIVFDPETNEIASYAKSTILEAIKSFDENKWEITNDEYRMDFSTKVLYDDPDKNSIVGNLVYKIASLEDLEKTYPELCL